jgi:hypothetical protein
MDNWPKDGDQIQRHQSCIVDHWGATNVAERPFLVYVSCCHGYRWTEGANFPQACSVCVRSQGKLPYHQRSKPYISTW